MRYHTWDYHTASAFDATYSYIHPTSDKQHISALGRWSRPQPPETNSQLQRLPHPSSFIISSATLGCKAPTLLDLALTTLPLGPATGSAAFHKPSFQNISRLRDFERERSAELLFDFSDVDTRELLLVELARPPLRLLLREGSCFGLESWVLAVDCVVVGVIVIDGVMGDVAVLYPPRCGLWWGWVCGHQAEDLSFSRKLRPMLSFDAGGDVDVAADE